MTPDTTVNVTSVSRKIAEFTRALHRAVSADPSAVWSRLTRGASSLLPNVEHASITVVDSRAAVRSRASTDRHAAAMEKIQQCYLEGPGIEAARQHQTQRVESLASETRWRTFVANANGTSPIQSILTFSLFEHEKASGALNLFADEPHAFSDEAGLLAEVFADNAAVIIEAAHRDSRLRHLLTNHDIVGQAKGVMMERFGLDAIAAASMLTQLSTKRRQPLPVVARNLLKRRTAER